MNIILLDKVANLGGPCCSKRKRLGRDYQVESQEWFQTISYDL
mgnify:CR=1 FL=1